jgi:hypothetical protein
MKVFKENEDFNTSGSSLSGYVSASYPQLVRALGEPTFDKASGDDKVQKEWVVQFKGNVFTIYDWKTFDEEYTMNKLGRFNVGSKGSALEFIDALENKLKE